jgi:Protein of unknown function (DUF2911)
MNLFIRSSFQVLFLFLLLSCQNTDKKTDSEKQGKKDTSVVKTETSNPYDNIDISPMDMSYFPEDYPKLKMTNSVDRPPVMRIIYSRPHLQGRKMFGQILKYGEPWRLGANEATEIQFYKDVTIQGKKIKAGRYMLYCIPYEDKWTIVFNSNIDSWGLKIDPSKDLYRFDIPVSTNNPSLEYFTMVFEKTDRGANLLMGWETILARLAIEFPS